MPPITHGSTVGNILRCGSVAGIAIIALSFAISTAAAQSADRITIPLTDPARPAEVKAELVHGSIILRGYDGKEVVVEARLRVREAAARENKMKHILTTTTGLSVEERNNIVQIEAGASLYQIVDMTIMVPLRTSVNLTTTSDGDISVTGIEGDMEIGAIGGDVTLKNVAGSAVAHTLKGRLLAQFDRVNPQKPMAFSSLSGDLDLTFPANLKANYSINSNRGDIFTDFDLQVQPSEAGQALRSTKGADGKYRIEADRNVRGTVDGGGQQIQLRTYSGRIYIRKAGGFPD